MTDLSADVPNSPRDASLSAEVDRLFREYYVKFGGQEPLNAMESDPLPDIFHSVPRDHELLPQKLREEARSIILERKNHEMLDSEQFETLWNLLNVYSTPPDMGQEKFITYDNFKKAAQKVAPEAKRYFTASTFAKLIFKEDPLSRVSITTFFNYVMKSVWLQQTRIGISLYDVTGEGYLREGDLENYIFELMPSLCQLSNMDSAFRTFYICTVVRKFLFFLDPLHAGRVRITDILASGFLDAMLELREPKATESQLAKNWFSLQSAKLVYSSYLQLDTDRNGMLTREELSRFGSGTLTSIFLNRIFDVCITYDGEMDYKAYLDFVLAMENKSEPQAIAYFFRVLDIGGRGRLNGLTLKYFYNAIEESLRSGTTIPPEFDDVYIEIFDMVKPTNPDFLTLDDLIKSGKGEAVVNILTDLNGFLAHENRENFETDALDEAEL